jgi:hypothetical protein
MFDISRFKVGSNPNTTYCTMNTAQSPTSFTGTSTEADLAEALNKAVEQAEKSLNTSHPLVKWRIEKISEKHGGIAGFKEISVTNSRRSYLGRSSTRSPHGSIDHFTGSAPRARWTVSRLTMS